MPMTKTYQHFCPIARSLELIGEKWSLLIVRDLLRGPQRFSDLQRYIGGITPKWLSARLRDLEAAGIVERDSAEGRREVWYRLTPKGKELSPVIESLAIWGVEHASRPPLEGETVHPEQVLAVMSVYMNKRGPKPDEPVRWQFRFGERGSVSVRFNGERWTSRAGESEADLTITTTPEDLIAFLNARRRDRAPLLETLTLDGPKDGADQFLRIMLGALPVASA
jgi:DNA-binding HxlR family transcriptional regulator